MLSCSHSVLKYVYETNEIFISSFNDGFNGDVCYFLYEWG